MNTEPKNSISLSPGSCVGSVGSVGSVGPEGSSLGSLGSSGSTGSVELAWEAFLSWTVICFEPKSSVNNTLSKKAPPRRKLSSEL